MTTTKKQHQQCSILKLYTTDVKDIILGFVQNSIRSAKRNIIQKQQRQNDSEQDQEARIAKHREYRRNYMGRKEELKRKERAEFANNFLNSLSNSSIKVILSFYGLNLYFKDNLLFRER